MDPLCPHKARNIHVEGRLRGAICIPLPSEYPPNPSHQHTEKNHCILGGTCWAGGTRRGGLIACLAVPETRWGGQLIVYLLSGARPQSKKMACGLSGAMHGGCLVCYILVDALSRSPLRSCTFSKFRVS